MLNAAQDAVALNPRAAALAEKILCCTARTGVIGLGRGIDLQTAKTTRVNREKATFPMSLVKSFDPS